MIQCVIGRDWKDIKYLDFIIDGAYYFIIEGAMDLSENYTIETEDYL